jgi:hypothetical protein|tara:strand:+ start:157 stop:711 length:555 start_codon:yes stop_codon:yes gene_type:complete
LENSEESLEDLAGEKKVTRRTENLNLAPIGKGSVQRGTRKETNFHFRGKVKIEGKENDMRECKECHRILPSTAFNTHVLRSNGAFALFRICRECRTTVNAEVSSVRKNAPPKSDLCTCCHGKKILQIDHIHGTTTFRGWVCRNCNTGIGSLGDTLEGVLRAAIYLEKDKSKIIEALNEIKNERI